MFGDVQIVTDVPAAFAGLVRQRRPRSIALSGGDTAEQAYAHLARFPDIDWSGVEVLIGDERWVDVDHVDSNEGMARRVLLDVVGAERVHSMRQAGSTPDEAAAAYGALLEELGAVELVHLGLGPDGHTASLFPGTAALEESTRLVVPNGDDLHPHERLTFTFPAIERARLAVVTVAGDEKAEAFARVMAGEDLPAGRIRADEVIWLVDPEAAARVESDAAPGGASDRGAL